MKISELFGIKFARKYKYKAQVIADFKRWKRENQYFLTLDRNRKKLFERIFKKYIEEHPKGYRSYEEIASDLWEALKVEVAKTNWQQVFDKVLGGDVELPNYQINPHISRKDTKELFRDYNCKHYYLTESAVVECEKVNITELDMEWLRDAEDGKRQLNWGDHFIRYQKKGDKIIAVAASFTHRQECKYLLHTFFVFDLNTPKLPFDPIAEILKEQCEKDLDDYPKEFEEKMRMLLYKMITFLDLIPLKQITLPKWGVLETDSSSSNQTNLIDPVYNNENVQITVVTVNANWNCSVFIEETWVEGHWRDYLCGKKRSKIKRRFVKKFFRRGYERVAGKLKSVSNTCVSDAKVVKLQPNVTVAATDVGGGGKGQPNKQEPLNLFQAKLEELKKKFNG